MFVHEFAIGPVVEGAADVALRFCVAAANRSYAAARAYRWINAVDWPARICGYGAKTDNRGQEYGRRFHGCSSVVFVVAENILDSLLRKVNGLA